MKPLLKYLLMGICGVFVIVLGIAFDVLLEGYFNPSPPERLKNHDESILICHYGVCCNPEEVKDCE